MKAITIIIPLYNEEYRLKNLFYNIIRFSKKNIFKIQFVLVDDGSSDNTGYELKKFKKKIEMLKIKKKIQVIVIFNKQNFGKGRSIKNGSKKAIYDFILTCDADLSVKFEQLSDWIKKGYIDFKCANKAYFASRTHPKSVVVKKIHREILGSVYNFLNNILFYTGKNDTQCGFKLYPKKFKSILENLTIDRYAHDIEIFHKIRQKKGIIKFLPVEWSHKRGSKVNLFTDSLKMLIDTIKFKITI